MPAAPVILAPVAYIKVAAVKKLVVGSWERAGGLLRGKPLLVPRSLPLGAPPMLLDECPVWPLRSTFLPGRVGSTSRPGGTWLLPGQLPIDVPLRARVGLGVLSHQMDPLYDVCIFFSDESSWLAEVMCAMSACFAFCFISTI